MTPPRAVAVTASKLRRDPAGPGRAGPGRAGPGRAGPGRSGPGRAGPGRAGSRSAEEGPGWKRRAGALVAALVPPWGAAAVLFLVACGPPILEVPAAVRNHHDVAVRSDGSLTPLFLMPGSRPGVCLEVAPTTDTSRWEARLSLDGIALGDGFTPPSARMEQVLCFEGEIPPDVPATREARLCGRRIDRFDQTVRRLPCHRVGYLPRTAYGELRKDLHRLLLSSPEKEPDELLSELDALAARAKRDFPIFAAQLDLISVYHLRVEGTPAARSAAFRRLASLPAWLDRGEASSLAAEAALEKALLELGAGDLGGGLTRAWRLLATADRAAIAVAYPKRFMVTAHQADILARQGAVAEAIDRLRSALEECRHAPCDPALLPSAYGQLAWLIQFQREATPEELGEAERALRRLIGELPRYTPLERINQLLNLALLKVRQDSDPGEPLRQARTLLARTTTGTEAVRHQRAWIDLISGLAALKAGDPASARRLCTGIEPSRDPQIRALAASCEARARRSEGDLEGAARAFERALELHEFATSQQPGEGLPLGFGPQSEDFARAARLAVERGRPEHAWGLLARLDSLSVREGQRRRCREQASDAATLDRWRRIDAELERLLAELIRLEVPASPARRREIERTRRALTDRLRELWRRWPGCTSAAQREDRGAAYRAVALEDEILLLHRGASGRISTVRRTPLDRRRLRGRVEEIAERRGEMDDGAWRWALAPIARALVPDDPERLPAVTRFSLHGGLQGLPLAALPLPAAGSAEPGGAPAWLGQVTTPVLVPAGASFPRRPSAPASAPLFVVDPSGDLPGGTDLLAFYRRLFPEARILAGEEATRRAVRGALAASDWLHIDAHGRYEPSFPELSGVQLRDGPMTLVELAGLAAPRRFANLSGCQTGRWPFTEDSGRFGVAGLLVQLGSAWVITSRHDLSDDLARDFNRTFYRAIAAGREVPAAYAEALAELRKTSRAASWGAFLLLAGAEDP